MRHSFLSSFAALIAGCATDDLLGEEPLSQSGPPAMEMVAGAGVPGSQMRVMVRGAPPFADVHVLLSTRGLGVSCPPILAGDCLDLAGPVRRVATATAGQNGYAEVWVNVPPGAPQGALFGVQAAAIDPAAAAVALSQAEEGRLGGAICPRIWAPVCGLDGVTYSNDCEAEGAGMFIAYNGPC